MFWYLIIFLWGKVFLKSIIDFRNFHEIQIFLMEKCCCNSFLMLTHCGSKIGSNPLKIGSITFPAKFIFLTIYQKEKVAFYNQMGSFYMVGVYWLFITLALRVSRERLFISLASVCNTCFLY